MTQLMRCEAVSGGRFDSPRCKNMTTKNVSGIPYCGDEHDFETAAEMWERLYRETLWRANQYEKMYAAKCAEVVALREQLSAVGFAIPVQRGSPNPQSEDHILSPANRTSDRRPVCRP